MSVCVSVRVSVFSVKIPFDEIDVLSEDSSVSVFGINST